MSPVVLHGFWRSSSSHRVRIALAYKGIPYTLRSVHLGQRAQLEADFLQLNPAGQVPVLEHDGHVLTQSIAILQYLDLTWPEPPLFPAAPHRAALVWELVERVNSFLQPFQMPGSVRRELIQHLDLEPDRAAKGIAAFVNAQLHHSLALLDQQVSHTAGQFCIGNHLTAADVVVIPQLDGAVRLGLSRDDFPTLKRIHEHCMTQHCFQVAAPANQPDAP